MRYKVSGDLKITIFVGVENLEVEADSEEEAVVAAAERVREEVYADPENYLYEMEWEEDAPTTVEES